MKTKQRPLTWPHGGHWLTQTRTVPVEGQEEIRVRGGSQCQNYGQSSTEKGNREIRRWLEGEIM